MQFRAEAVIANSRNVRQNSFADVVERGDIVTSDGVIIASSNTDNDGNTTRYYPYKNMFAHLVGYDNYGRAGLELQGNFYMLRSHVNLPERISNEINNKKNRGDNLVTTVNYKLQEAAYNALGSCNGAVVVLEPDTGKILAMVSKPDYDPNQISTLWDYLHTDEGSSSTVLLNRATQGMYTPGSTFKVVTLLEYVRENENTYDKYSFNCEGIGFYSGVEVHCVDEKKHGNVSLKDSLAYSCNNSFANMGNTIDMDSFEETAEKLLFNSELPYAGEYSQSLFTISKDSDRSELPQTVFGQGDTKLTPLHNAMICAAIANDGIMMTPYLIEKIESDDGKVVKKFNSKEYGSVMSAEEADVLTEYMKAVCDYGTAGNRFSGASYDMAGKTGTAEYDAEKNCNSWFIGFNYPDNPEIVVSVVVEDSNKNGLTGANVAKQIFDVYETIK